MHKKCIKEFLTKSSPCYVEKHSDISDFGTPSNVPVLAPKDGSHKRLNQKRRKKFKPIVTTQRFCNDLQQYSVYTQYDRNTQQKNVNLKRQIPCRDKKVYCTSNYIDMAELSSGRNNRNQTSCIEKKCSSKLSLSVRNKIGPCLSNLLKRSSENYNYRTNCKTQSNKESYYCDNAYCAYCEHRRTKKLNKLREDISIQPVYTLTKNIKRFPFRRVINDCECVELSQPNVLERNNSDCSYEYSLFSGSKHEDIKVYKHKKLMKHIMQKLEKQMRREYTNAGISKHQNQQFPSKMNVKSPCQIYVTTSCQTKISSSESAVYNKLPSNSSEFWDFLLQKIKYQIHKAEVRKDEANDTCINICNKDSCKLLKSVPSNNSTNKPKPQRKGSEQFLEKQESLQCCPTCNKYSSEAMNEAVTKKKNTKVDCECHKKEQKSSNSKTLNKAKSQDLIKPIEDQHDALTKTLADKYQAQILCIHNPPCVLINGCLNLPPPKASSREGTYFYPVTQTKRSSFAQMCQKMKRSKQKSNDQAIQYHPPYVDLQEMLPEFRTEKIVQSVCNHNPPCEVVRGCYKPRYNPTLQTSCVHVPMCPKVPECLLEQKNIGENACNHQPKCPELHLCTRKYILLTAKENATTQVKPKAKIACRHQPPCLMIPKCLAQAICGDWIAGNAIPGCVHEPSCEMIPACCRKQDKQSVSVPSQYPSASCRIV